MEKAAANYIKIHVKFSLKRLYLVDCVQWQCGLENQFCRCKNCSLDYHYEEDEDGEE